MGIMAYFPKINFYQPNKEFRFIILGPKNSGKTTFLLNLVYPEDKIPAIPTKAFNTDTIIYKKYSIHLLDMTEEEWKKQSETERINILNDRQALIFFVDCTKILDNKYQKETKKLFSSFLNLEIKKSFPFVIVANKRDLVPLVDTEQLRIILDLDKITDRKYYITTASVKEGEGLNECLDFLINSLEIEQIIIS